MTWTLLRLACRENLFYDSVILSALLFFTTHSSLEIPSVGSSMEPALDFVLSFLAASQASYETFQVLLMGITPIPFITVLSVYLSLTVLDIVSSLARKP